MSCNSAASSRGRRRVPPGPRRRRAPPALVGLLGVLWKMERFDEVSLIQKKYEYQAMQAGSKNIVVGFYQIAPRSRSRKPTKPGPVFASKIVEQSPTASRLAPTWPGSWKGWTSLRRPRRRSANWSSDTPKCPAWVALATFQSLRASPKTSPGRSGRSPRSKGSGSSY